MWVEQYRYPVRRRRWELPQGSWSSGQGGTASELAAAELREETGLRADRLEHLGHLYGAYGMSSQGFDVHLATGLRPGPPEREVTEQDMQLRQVSASTFVDMVRSGHVVDAATLAAYGLLQLGGRRAPATRDGSSPPAYRAGMDQRISLITLGVADVERSRQFYERLGWRGQTVEGAVFFSAGGSALVLWDRAALAADAGVADAGPGRSGGVALAHNVRTRAEVDELVVTAAAAGATVTRAPAETSYGGYAGYVADPDGHLWEFAWNPGFPLAEDGSLTVPDLGGRTA